MSARRKQPKIEGWFRQLDGGRVEIYLKCDDRKIRCSGPEEDMFELVDWFESRTGLRVESPSWRRVRRGPPVPDNQMALVVPELSSDATVTSHG
jgi:hypothetical protein